MCMNIFVWMWEASIPLLWSLHIKFYFFSKVQLWVKIYERQAVSQAASLFSLYTTNTVPENMAWYQFCYWFKSCFCLMAYQPSWLCYWGYKNEIQDIFIWQVFYILFDTTWQHSTCTWTSNDHIWYLLHNKWLLFIYICEIIWKTGSFLCSYSLLFPDNQCCPRKYSLGPVFLMGFAEWGWRFCWTVCCALVSEHL